MNELATLLPIAPATVGTAHVQTVDARKLHAFLEVGKDFSNWIKDRISQYDFVENVDYLVAKIGEQLPSGTKYRTDYHLTLDTAKEIAMVERNEKGKLARRYFIDCERKLHERPILAVDLNDPVSLRGALLAYIDQNQEKAEIIERQDEALLIAGPKAAAFDRIANAEGLLNLTNTAKALNIPPGKFFATLRAEAWIYRRAGGRENVAYQSRIQSGYLTHKVHIAKREDGSERVCEQVMVTPKGLHRLAGIFSVTLDQEAA